MKKIGICLTVVISFLLMGCFGGKSKPSSFYTLSVSEKTQPISTIKKSIGVLPVRIPDFLDRPQIVLSANSTQLNVSETNRWIEPLSLVTQRVLIADIQKELPNAYVKTKGYDNAVFQRLIQVEVNGMNGEFDKEATLSVWWSVLNNNGQELYRSRFESAISMGKTYDSFVLAQSVLWGQLSEAIAQYVSNH
ncbi:MAG: membrane integrity-associated transporter subunit PqiC [Alphaproteobacteria bacterium]|nr:membrane integrity-associated transporter subunit PqiC [Alphaproteobacteria bacterium]